MSQSNDPQSKSNANVDELAAVALQQYNDTKGHFSLVRWATALASPLGPFIPRTDRGGSRNFRLADLVTIMNGFCGSFSLFSSANYCLTGDEYYLHNALLFPLGGLIFDFLDGKVARWRKSSSMLGQELDSLADLVRTHLPLSGPTGDPTIPSICRIVDIVRSSACGSGLCRRPSDDSGHRRAELLYLLRTRTSRQVQCHRGAGAQGRIRKGTLFRGTAHPVLFGVGRAPLLLG